MLENNALFIPLLIIGQLIIFALFWSAIVWLTSRLGGWATIAATYPQPEPLPPLTNCWSFQSAILRLAMSYNYVLTVCTDDEGLYVKTLLPFRPGNAPFFVPWEEISGQKKMFFLYQVVDLRFARTPDIPFRVYGRLADAMVQASDGRWSYSQT